MGKYSLVVVDYYSRYFAVNILTSTSAQSITDCLVELFVRSGVPKSVTVDNGLQFTDHRFNNPLRAYRVEH